MQQTCANEILDALGPPPQCGKPLFSWCRNLYYALCQLIANSGGGSGEVVPPGIMSPYAGSTAPNGYVLCYGQAIGRVSYAALFAAIGTTFGVGDGSTTFNVPDFRGRAGIGLDNMGGSSANRMTDTLADVLGGSGGSELVTLLTANLASHTHQVANRDARFTAASGGYNLAGDTGGTQIPITTTSAGSGTAHRNDQPWLATNVVIKT